MHRRTRPALVLLAVVAVTSVALGSGPATASRPGDVGRYDTWVGYDVGRYTADVAAADLDGDGRRDAVWVRDDFADFDEDEFSNSISVTMNLGDGTLGTPRTYRAGPQSSGVVTPDLDGDGDRDVAVSSVGNDLQNDVVDLYLNDGTGAMTPATATGGNGPESITAGDVDDDGDVDLVLTNYGAETVSILRNNGDATFAPEETVQIGFTVSDAVVGDYTGDGDADVVAVVHNQDTQLYDLHVLERGPGDTFVADEEVQSVEMRTNGGVGRAALAPADFDGDGDTDLAMSGVAAFEHLVLENDGSGVFDRTAYESFVMTLEATDLDDDDDVDLVGVGGGGGIRGTAIVQRNAGGGSFGPVQELVTGSNPIGLDAADLQGDGRPDLLVAARDIGTGVTHLQRSNGTFGAPDAGQNFAPSVDVATGDVDGNGTVDVAAAVASGFVAQNSIEVQLGDGTGDLSTGATIPAGGTLPRSVALSDLDGDDDLDLSWLVGDGPFVEVVTALNTGGGTYAAPTSREAPTCTDHLTTGDADGDGNPDLLLGNEDFGCNDVDEDAAAILLNTGDGTFAPAPRFVPMALFTAEVQVADVDGDDVPDLVGGGVGRSGDDGGRPEGDLVVRLGTGDGGFGARVLSTSDSRHREMVVRDLDGDGLLDVATITFEEGVVVGLGDGTGAFPTIRHVGGEQISGYRNAVGLAVGDVDGDSIDDIAVANESGSDVGLHYGFGDGTFEQRQVRYGMRPRVTDVELADLDSDGVLDVVSPAQLEGGGFRGARTAAAAPGDDPGLTLLLGRRPACTVTGTEAAETLRGTRASDVICGAGGDDVLVGRTGGDILRGGAGADRLLGADGVDVLDGGQGPDLLRGATGADLLRGAAGTDRLTGAEGRDVVDLLDSTRSAERGDGGPGRDRCRGDRRDVLTSCA